MPYKTLPVVLMAILSLGCGKDTTWPDRPGPKVVVSFAPIYCFTANVAGDDAVVRNMMTTSGPHDFNPTDTDARLVRKADLFFVNGLGLDENQAATVKKGSGNRNLKVVALSERIPADKIRDGECHHAANHGAHEHGKDPHVWLSPDHAILMIEGIRDELKAADPAHVADYDRRATEYCDRLRKLKADGLEMLKGKSDRRLVTFHESLTYFAEAFDLKIAGVVQKLPGVEPNDDEMSALVQLCAKEKIRLIAVEPQYTTRTSAGQLLGELKRKGIADAELVEIDPLETVRPDDLTPDWYERKMRANLDALGKAMK